MNRRDLIKRASYLLGGALIISSSETFLNGCSGESNRVVNGYFTDYQQKTIEALVDTFIPEYHIVGATKAGVAPFISMMLMECYAEEARELFKEGLSKLDEVADNLYKTSFRKLGLDRREQIVKELNIGKAMTKQDTNESLYRFFQLAFELTYLGYFTSEIVATQVLGYVHIPGKYEPCEKMENKQSALAI